MCVEHLIFDGSNSDGKRHLLPFNTQKRLLPSQKVIIQIGFDALVHIDDMSTL